MMGLIQLLLADATYILLIIIAFLNQHQHFAKFVNSTLYFYTYR